MARRQAPEPEQPYEPPATRAVPPESTPDWLPAHEDGDFFGLEQDAVNHRNNVTSAERFATLATNLILGVIVVFIACVLATGGYKILNWMVGL